MEKVLFISNQKFLDPTLNEGGVRVCTLEFIDLLKTRFEVLLFPVDYSYTYFKRIKIRLGINIYDDYNTEEYRDRLLKTLQEQGIRYVFLNLTNTMRFASLIKSLEMRDVKVILCSHGNETGDYLHETVRFTPDRRWFKWIVSSYTLGSLLKLESVYRLRYIDMVLSVSPVEEQIEKWLGSRYTFMVPRTVNFSPVDYSPVLNRIGFIGDLSHWPNKFGILSLCEALSKLDHHVVLRLVGGTGPFGKEVESRFDFVEYAGFLPAEELEKEVSSWALFLNPVFYCSRGVSTKLAKALGWGLPVISTDAGTRGYKWENGKLLIAEDAGDMARQIVENAGNRQAIDTIRTGCIQAAKSAPLLKQIMDDLYPVLMKL